MKMSWGDGALSHDNFNETFYSSSCVHDLIN